jgi:hypothetical protein
VLQGVTHEGKLLKTTCGDLVCMQVMERFNTTRDWNRKHIVVYKLICNQVLPYFCNDTTCALDGDFVFRILGATRPPTLAPSTLHSPKLACYVTKFYFLI